jgi:hypothetical protein
MGRFNRLLVNAKVIFGRGFNIFMPKNQLHIPNSGQTGRALKTRG